MSNSLFDETVLFLIQIGLPWKLDLLNLEQILFFVRDILWFYRELLFLGWRNQQALFLFVLFIHIIFVLLAFAISINSLSFKIHFFQIWNRFLNVLLHRWKTVLYFFYFYQLPLLGFWIKDHLFNSKLHLTNFDLFLVYFLMLLFIHDLFIHFFLFFVFLSSYLKFKKPIILCQKVKNINPK